jgi:excisionase family DNA binding protein
VSLREAIARLVSNGPPDAMVSFRWLAEQLNADAGAVAVHSEPQPPADVAIDQTVKQVAERFGRKASTVRTWAERGLLPGAYRMHGREWRIPSSAIAALQKSQAAEVRAERRDDAPPAIGDWRKHMTRTVNQ